MSLMARVANARANAYGAIGSDDAVPGPAVVLGLGNVLLGDDGAGVHVIERLGACRSLPPDVHLVDGGTLNFSLLEQVESASILVVVDASDLGQPPGTVRVFADDAMDDFLAAPTQRSVHDVNLGDLLRMCALRDALPLHRYLVGIQPENIDWQPGPSAAVDAGIDRACERIRSVLMELMT